MAVIRCDKCAVRLLPDQEFCHKCGEPNSEFGAGKGARKGRSPLGTGIGVCAVLAVFAIGLRFTPTSMLDKVPGRSDIMGLRRTLFGDTLGVPDAVGDYLRAWKSEDVLEMLKKRLPGSKGSANDARYVVYPVKLHSYSVKRVVLDGTKAYALVIAEVSDIDDAVRSTATMKGKTSDIVNPAIKAALMGADAVKECYTVKLNKQDGEWKILEGLDPSADEFLAPIRKLKLSGQDLPVVSDSWDRVTTGSLSCGRDRLGAVKLSGIVENPTPDDLGPYEIVATFYGSDGTQVGQAASRGSALRKESFVPFACSLWENGSGSVEKYSVAVRSLY